MLGIGHAAFAQVDSGCSADTGDSVLDLVNVTDMNTELAVSIHLYLTLPIAPPS